MIHEGLRHLAVPIDDVTPVPGNPHKGKVDRIADSLAIHGQYSPIVVNRRTGQIVAGNTTWHAARSLGADEIAVSYIDVDQKRQKKIGAVDNRSAQKAKYDEEARIDFLEGLPDLDGTGYTDDELAALKASLEPPETFGGSGEGGKPSDDSKPDAVVRAGDWGFAVDADLFADWRKDLVKAHGSTGAPGAAMRMLGFPDDPERRLRLSDADKADLTRARAERIEKAIQSGEHSILLDDLNVPIDSVEPYPGNFRRGDLPTICESLTENGQFRPIVVDKTTGYVLKGNHTWQAAKLCDWTEIAAVFIEVDEEQAARIVAVDNRTSDLGEDDTVDLLTWLDGLGGDLDGTGYDEYAVEALEREVEDIHAALRRANEGPPVRVAIGRWVEDVPPGKFATWEIGLDDEPGEPPQVMASRLGLNYVSIL